MSHNFEDDLDLSLCVRAHAGTSHVPEDRGLQERAGYARTLRADLAALRDLARNDDDNAWIAQAFNEYRQGYATCYRAMLAARAQCVSTMIAGPSNFNVRRANKRNATADRRTAELGEYRLKALARMRKHLRPEEGPVMAGDDDAIERLEAQLAEAQRKQEHMKAVNACIRKYRSAGEAVQIAHLVSTCGISGALAQTLIEGDPLDRKGYATYQLTNNGANIRRLNERLEQLRKAKATPIFEAEGRYGRVEDDPPANRVRVYFPAKPEARVIDTLKRSGFRWAPSNGAWQAYRNAHTVKIAREIAGSVEEVAR